MKKTWIIIGLCLTLTACAAEPEAAKIEEPLIIEETVSEEVAADEQILSYEVIAEQYKDGDHVSLSYPIIKGMKGELTQDYLNQSLKSVMDVYGDGSYKQVSIDYEITYMDEDYLSVLYTGTVEIDGFKAFDVVKSITLDMRSSNEITVDNFLVGENPLDTLKEIFENEDIKDFEAESVFMYFKDDSVVFYYMPLDDDAEFRFIPVKIEGYGDYFNWDFGPHPAS